MTTPNDHAPLWTLYVEPEDDQALQVETKSDETPPEELEEEEAAELVVDEDASLE